MKGLRRLLGFFLYLAMAFPLTLAGLSLVSLRPVLGDAEAAKALVSDQRFERLVASPDLRELAPDTLRLSGAILDGKAATAAFQAAVPASVVVATASDAIDSAFAAAAAGRASFPINAVPLKRALESGADAFASTYQRETRLPRSLPEPGQAGGADIVRVPEGAAGLAFLREAAVQAARSQPDAWIVGEPGSRLELDLDGRIARADVAGLAGLTGAGAWLLVTGAGLCFASVMVSDGDWRRRFGRLGSRLLAPSIIVLAIGLAPRLVLPSGILTLPSGMSGASLPDLVEYLRFVASSLGRGFLVSGLAGLGVGTVFASLKRALPESADDGDEA